MKDRGGDPVNCLLVTGGAGFIGSNFIHYLLEKNQSIHIVNLDALTYAGNLDNLTGVENTGRYTFIKGDICDKTLVQNLFTRYQFDGVVNFAAESHVDRSIRDADIFVRTNVLGTLSLLEAARNAWAEGESYRKSVRFVQISTDEVYGSLGKDGFFTEKTPLDPHSPYSASKAGADLLVKSYFDTHKLPVIITRCSNNYGPYQFPEKLMPLMILSALHRKKLPVYGDGLHIRDWIYVKDHCRAIALVLEKGQPGEVYNIGANEEHTNLQIVHAILKELQKDKNHDGIDESLIAFVEDRKGHDRRYAIDSSKIRKELGWSPRVTFEDGIRQTVQWYRNHPAWWKRILDGEYRDYYRRMYGKSENM